MQERVYQKPIQDIDDLKRWLIAAWSGIHQQVIDQAISDGQKLTKKLATNSLTNFYRAMLVQSAVMRQ